MTQKSLNNQTSQLKLFPGVVTGSKLLELLAFCKKNHCALPAVNVTGTNSINAALQAAKEAQTPIIIQFSHSGAAFFAGKNIDNSDHQASIMGAASAAMLVRTLSELYGVSVVLHTDHCPKENLPWVDGLLEISKEYYQSFGEPLFSSHMLDLSALPLEENIKTCRDYMQKMAKQNILLELEVGLTGGEEDGLDNSQADQAELYTNPADILETYQKLHSVGAFTLAAAFGNVHGVYAPGNVKLEPKILELCQQTVAEYVEALSKDQKSPSHLPGDKFANKNSQVDSAKKDFLRNEHQPLNLVFHGGSGSPTTKIKEALQYGVIKFNIDTDTQWAFARPVKKYMDRYDGYLQSQVGNPKGEDKPNKKQIDPRVWLFEGEKGMTKKLVQMFEVLESRGKFEFVKREE